jgi:hypothetical protein
MAKKQNQKKQVETEFNFNQFGENPRKTDDSRLEKLEHNLEELGDLSGIVHNISTDEIICGNQRSKVMQIDKSKIEILLKFDEPDEQGTIALGFINHNGKKYNFRQVDWSKEQIDKAAIIANVHAGFWDFEALQEWDSSFLKEAGFNDWELSMINSQDSDLYSDRNEEIDVSELDDELKLTFKFNLETFNLVKEALSYIHSSPEQALLKILNIEDEEQLL